jgi:misacylated tRNA(Ala) deacylase
MTELLYQTDSYLREFDAGVVGLDEASQSLALDRTAFYPGGGGQPGDLGVLDVAGEALEIAGVAKRGDTVWHRFQGSPPAAGTRVTGRLDWERRYRLMRTHTSLHILCGVMWRDYGAQVTGGNMAPLEGRLDFELDTLQRAMIEEIEEKVNREVALAREVLCKILPREEAEAIPDLIRTKVNLLPSDLKTIRTVEIVGLDQQADGGTHVANTREVGNIRVINYKSKGRINKRIRIALKP